MDKNAIKKYAIWARRELLSRVKQKAEEYGITAAGTLKPNEESVHGKLLTQTEQKQRCALVLRVLERGYDEVIDEAAYTWFNRFIALRFMEVNGYLPSHVRVFTDEDNSFKPQILTEAIHLELPGLDMDRVYQLKTENKTEELFRYLLITQCNALSEVLPGMFQKIADYTELLLPDNLLREGSVIERLVNADGIPEADWVDQVQIIGWLYQYYNTEPKDTVFANLKKNIKIEAKDIPAATQQFTPDWIVRYMVENSLGRLWLAGHPNEALKANWRYYLDEAEQEPQVQAQLDELRVGYAKLRPEEIKVIDPCCGSGHIAVYMFDVLMQIYESQGWTQRDAVRSILENNLYALDIDDRAAQLAYFAVMMKARAYDRRFLTRRNEDDKPDIPQPHVYSIPTWIEKHETKEEKLSEVEKEKKLPEDRRSPQIKALCTLLEKGNYYGSLIQATSMDWNQLRMDADNLTPLGQTQMDEKGGADKQDTDKRLVLRMITVCSILSDKYDVVVTNPPYMGASGMSTTLSQFVKDNYPDSKGDLSTVMMERALSMTKQSGYVAMINIPVWMFLSSFEKLRGNILRNNTYINMVHPGRGIFGSDFGTTSFVIAKQHIPGHKGSYRRLFDVQGEVKGIEEREQAFLSGKGQYTANQDNFSKIPGAPVAYWVSNRVLELFRKCPNLNLIASPKQGLITGDNDRFLRFWHEVKVCDIALSIDRKKKWKPINKGGEYRKWYGNQEYIINWDNDGYEIQNFMDASGKLRSRPQNLSYNFKESVSWSLVTSGGFSARFYPDCFMFNVAGISCFPGMNLPYILGLLNTKIAACITQILNPTINMNAGDVARIPILISDGSRSIVSNYVNDSINLTRTDWDSFETSWNFQENPLVRWSKTIWDATSTACTMSNYYGYQPEFHSPLEECFLLWQGECQERFNQLKANEPANKKSRG